MASKTGRIVPPGYPTVGGCGSLVSLWGRVPLRAGYTYIYASRPFSASSHGRSLLPSCQ